MRILHDRHSDEPPMLFVLLPGAMQRPEDLLQAGFAEDVRERGLAVDLALVDLGLPYIGDFSNDVAAKRLHRAVLAEAAGRYEQIWLCGISIGGTVAGACADIYPGAAHGVCLLAPYPGDNLIVGEIRHAGGALQWRAPDNTVDAERRLWRSLQQAGLRGLDVHLGYGEQDRYAPVLAEMAVLLDESSVHIVPGRHDFTAWKPLWRRFLDRFTGKQP